MINWDISKEDARIVGKIATRALREDSDYPDGRQSIEMDLTACHANGIPLNFEKLLAFPAFDFFHDIYGIRRHIDRTTGVVGGCFLPRCAKPSPTLEQCSSCERYFLPSDMGEEGCLGCLARVVLDGNEPCADFPVGVVDEANLTDEDREHLGAK